MMIYRIISKASGLILDEGEFNLKNVHLKEASEDCVIEVGFEVEESNVHAYTRKEKILKVKFFEGDEVINKFNGTVGVICLGKTIPLNSTTPFWGFYVKVKKNDSYVSYSIFDSENECAWQKLHPTEN